MIMSSEDTEILEVSQYQKSNKVPFIVYADLECKREKIDGCKVDEYFVFRCKDRMKYFCELLREHAMKISSFKKKKKLKLLIKEMQKYVIFVKKNLKINI